MTRVLVGTYRQRDHIEDCLISVERNLFGVSDLVFIDDSGDDKHCDWLEQYGTVIRCGGVGYTRAMKRLCDAAELQSCFVLEEDFTIDQPTHLDELAELLWHRPYLAQVALLRQPWFHVEKQHGGVIEALQAKGHTFTDVAGLIEHTATFTCNPSLWRGCIFADGWPDSQWSEEVKGNHLVRCGFRFAYLPGVRCTHYGERRGHGY